MRKGGIMDMVQNLYILVGLPGAGKSTFAADLLSKTCSILLLNKDAIRSMVSGRYLFDTELEPTIMNIAMASVAAMLKDGYSVIVDETNLTPTKRKVWIELAFKATIKIKPVVIVFREQENNIENRMKDPRGYSREHWTDVIDGLKTIYEEPTKEEFAQYGFNTDIRYV
jgi:predicted kinase